MDFVPEPSIWKNITHKMSMDGLEYKKLFS